jgi:hypothetical protein
MCLALMKGPTTWVGRLYMCVRVQNVYTYADMCDS